MSGTILDVSQERILKEVFHLLLPPIVGTHPASLVSIKIGFSLTSLQRDDPASLMPIDATRASYQPVALSQHLNRPHVLGVQRAES